MLLSSLLAATLALSSSPAADPSVSLVRVYTDRAERAAEAPVSLAAATDLAPAAPELASPLQLRYAEELPYDAGGAASSDTRRIAALLLGLLVGFGTGHLVAGDTNGFVLWLLVDVLIITASTVLAVLTPFKLLYVGLLVSHIIQGLDAYAKAGGERIIERTRERAIRWAAAPGQEERGVTATRALAFSF